MLTEADVRAMLKETTKSAKPDAWPLDFNFLKEKALDSLDHVTFALLLKEKHGIDVGDEDLHKIVTIQGVLDYAAQYK